MGTPVPPPIVEAFGTNGDYTIIPVPSQTGVSPELASFNDGFPVATRTPRTSGGIPPRGLDMNGILFMSTAHIAWIAAGNSYVWNADVVSLLGGYNLGAIVRSAVDPSQFFYSTVTDNINDPDDDPTGWALFSPLSSPYGLQVAVPPAGPSDDYPLTAGAGFLDFNPTGGSATISGITAGTNGQTLTITNVHPTNSITLLALNGGSAAANQMRMPADITLLQYSSVNMRYSSSLGLWVATP